MNRNHWIRWVLFIALTIGAGEATVYSINEDKRDSMLIAAIDSGELADLVGITGGLRQGIERGMLLVVFRDGRKVGELLVTRSEENCSAALITEISDEESFQIGDRASPKVRTF